MARPLFSLDNRLRVCSEFVRPNKRLADIGTDHAYLPVQLTKTGKVPFAIAADINPEPLSRGEVTIEKYHAGGLVTTRLSNGLENINEDEADDIVIAGMGGELIAGILQQCLWAKNLEKHFVLQPMTRADALRKYLYESGFEIEKEKAVEADKKLYTVLSAFFTGTQTPLTAVSIYAGGLKPALPLSRKYIEQQIFTLQKQANGLLKSANPEQAQHILSSVKALSEYIGLYS